MRLATTLAVAVAAAVATSGAAHAEKRLAVGVSGGTTGVTGELTYKVNDYVHLRGGYNYFQYGMDDTYEDISYDGDLDLSTFGAFIDLHPFGNSFMLTGGAYIGDKMLELVADESSVYEINGTPFTSAQVGTLHLDAEMESTAPFVGLGWDTTFQNDNTWGFKIIAGAMFTGSPSVDLYTVGGQRTPAEDAILQAEIEEEEANLQDDVDDYEVYPVVQLGLTFAF
jgi:hypothetical protein